MLIEKIVKKSDGYYVQSEKGKNLGGPYKKIEDAERRLGQVEYFKNKNKKIDEEDTSKQTTRNKKLKRDVVRLAKQNGFEGIVNTKELTVHHINDSKNEDGLKDNSYKNLWFIKSKNWKDRELLHKVLHFMDRNNVSYDALLNRLEDIKLYQYDEATNSFKEKTLSVFKESLKENNWNRHNKRGMNEDMANDNIAHRIANKISSAFEKDGFIDFDDFSDWVWDELEVIKGAPSRDLDLFGDVINELKDMGWNQKGYDFALNKSSLTWKEIYDTIKRKNLSKSEKFAEMAELLWRRGYKGKAFDTPEDAVVAAMEMQEAMFGFYDPTVEEYNDLVSYLYSIKSGKVEESINEAYADGDRVDDETWDRLRVWEVNHLPKGYKFVDLNSVRKVNTYSDGGRKYDLIMATVSYLTDKRDGQRVNHVSQHTYKVFDDGEVKIIPHGSLYEGLMPTLSGDVIEIPKTAEPIYTDMRMGVPMNFYKIDGVIYDNLGFKVSDEELKELGLKEIFKRKKRNEVSEKLKEGAEGKREPGYEYVIYDYTDEDGPNPIVAIRSTATEAEYTAMRWMGNDYITNGRAHPKYEDRLLTFEKVPKGKFKVGDDFYGPFDQDYNPIWNDTTWSYMWKGKKLESLKEGAKPSFPELKKVSSPICDYNTLSKFEKDVLNNAVTAIEYTIKDALSDTIRENNKDEYHYLEDLLNEYTHLGIYGDEGDKLLYMPNLLKKYAGPRVREILKKHGCSLDESLTEDFSHATIRVFLDPNNKNFSKDVKKLDSLCSRYPGVAGRLSFSDMYTIKVESDTQPGLKQVAKNIMWYIDRNIDSFVRYKNDSILSELVDESLNEALNWDYAVRADYLDRPKDFKKNFAIGTKVIEKETGDLFFIAKHWKNTVGRYKNFMYLLPIKYWDNPKEGIKKHAGVNIDSLWFLSEYDFADGNPVEESYNYNVLPESEDKDGNI